MVVGGSQSTYVSRERWLRELFDVIIGFHELERDVLDAMGLWYICYMLTIRFHRTMMTALMKRWHLETLSFHLPIEEATITLENVWRILCVPIHGELVTYYVQWGTCAMHWVLGVRHLQVREVEIDLSPFISSADLVSLVLCGLVMGLVILDRQGRKFPIGWGVFIEQMFEHGTRYAWGMCLLAHLYRDMHEVAYRGARSIFASVFLLHVWAWEHNPVTKPDGILDQTLEDPYSYHYGNFLHYT